MMLRKLGRIPVALAVIGAYLNTAQLLAEFQPPGYAWIGWLGAASIGVGLFLCVEALLQRYHPVLLLGILFFGSAELAGQVLHAALVRADVVVMTAAMRWTLGYVSPGLVVLAGVVTAFVVHYGFPQEEAALDHQPATRADLAQLEAALAVLPLAPRPATIRQSTSKPAAPPSAQLPLVLATGSPGTANGGFARPDGAA